MMFSSTTAAGALGFSSFNTLGPSSSNLVNGPHTTGLTFKCERSHLSGQERGSRIAAYKTTADATFSPEKLVSISAMPAYEAKSHEELRSEDYNFPGKAGGLGLSSSAVKSTSPAVSFSTASPGTASIFSLPVKPNLDRPMSTWNYPGPTFTSQPIQFSPFSGFMETTTWKDPGSIFTSPPPLQFSPSATTVTSAPSNSFNPFTSAASTTVRNPFAQGTGFISAASTASSPLNHNPFTNPFTSLSTHTSSAFPAFTSPPIQFSASATTATSAPSNSFNPFTSAASTTVHNPFAPGTGFTSAASTASSVSLSPLNHNPFTNPCTSLSTHTSSSSPAFPAFTSSPLQFSASATTATSAPSNSFNPFTSAPSTTGFTSAAFTASSVSLSPWNHNPFTNPSTSLSTHTSSSSPAFPAFTGVVNSTPSSLNAFWTTPINGPVRPTITAAANCISVSPVSSGLSPAQNCNGTTGVVGQMSSSLVTNMEKSSPVASPFGTLPPKPHMIVDGSQSKQPIQYGISSLRVKDKPAPVKYSMLTTRHLSGRIKLPVRKYEPKSNAPKIPYFSDTKEIPVATYIPRENPRALVVCPEKWQHTATMQNVHEEKLSGSTYENQRDDPTEEKQLFTTVLDVPAKLQQPDYYTHPQISELEAKERAEPGFCRRVKDFVVGRHGYGSIKFLGETDVRKVDIETVVQFNNREVIVYMDDSKKPPVGEGLNKEAEITLLNIKCFDKKTGMQHTDGSKINKYTEMLKKKVAAQGAEFMSYDPVEGEWKFRVKHF
ncbi:nuclear pore complex protein NUP98A isoform X3 [Helianthus annuus]|uniref:nuclear pore complex protein NUP98A isoform X3 n=1 Tax=Helianthus annuus TaxID=4232 RepID=UPI001653175A|nr:nuclear pore complex protein NUP98A isoform X3 [Helianthus annuus]